MTYRDMECYFGTHLCDFFKLVKKRNEQISKNVVFKSADAKKDQLQAQNHPTSALFGFIRHLSSKALLLNRSKLIELTVPIKYDRGKTLVISFLKTTPDLKILKASDIRQTLQSSAKSNIQYSFLLIRQSNNEIMQDTDRI